MESYQNTQMHGMDVYVRVGMVVWNDYCFSIVLVVFRRQWHLLRIWLCEPWISQILLHSDPPLQI